MQEIIILLEKKRRLYVRLRECMAGLKDALQAGNSEASIAFQKLWDNLRASIDGIDRELLRAGFRPQSESPAVQKWVNGLKTLIKEIAAMHADCLACAEARSRDIKQEILSLQGGARAVRGYAVQRKNSPRFVDTTK